MQQIEQIGQVEMDGREHGREPGREQPRQIVHRLAAMVAAAEAGRRPGESAVLEGAETQAVEANDRVDAVLARAGRAKASRDASGRRRRRVSAAVAEALRESPEPPPRLGAVSTGWADVDRTLAERAGVPVEEGGLARGRLHEWFESGDEGDGIGGDGAPPLALLSHLADRGVADAVESGTGGVVAWVGHRVWPSPAFAGARRHLDRSLYLDPPDEAAMLWTLDLLVRCPAVAVVVADGRGLSMAATRRLQLAARAGRALVLLARPASERAVLSAAATRWTVAPVPTADGMPSWEVSLRRCKVATEHGRVGLSVGVGDGPASGGAMAAGRSDRAAVTGMTWRLRWTGAAVDDVTQEAVQMTTTSAMTVAATTKVRRHGHDARGAEHNIGTGRSDAPIDHPWLAARTHGRDAARDTQPRRRTRLGPAA